MRREGSRWAAPDRRATLEADGPRGARLRSIASAEQPVFRLSHRWSGGPSRITNGPDGWGPPRLASARSTRQCWGMLGSTGTDVARVLHASVSWTFCLSEKLPTSADSGLRITCAAAAVAVCHPRASPPPCLPLARGAGARRAADSAAKVSPASTPLGKTAGAQALRRAPASWGSKTAFLAGDRLCRAHAACEMLDGQALGWLAPGVTLGAPE